LIFKIDTANEEDRINPAVDFVNWESVNWRKKYVCHSFQIKGARSSLWLCSRSSMITVIYLTYYMILMIYILPFFKFSCTYVLWRIGMGLFKHIV